MTLTAADFSYVVALVRREAAIVLGPGKEYLVEARLLPVAREVGLGGVGELVAQLQRRPDPSVQGRVVDALTTNETSWFRDREPFTALTDAVLPQLVQARAATRRLRVWSAACSSGQEPYGLAMTLERALPAGWSYEIVASDISAEMVERARAGCYSQLEVNRGLPANLLVEYFERVGAHWRVNATLRRSVAFQRLNLAAPLPPMAPFDLVFLRNVLIYFDIETKRSVLRNVGRLMRPDALLFLGAAETTIGVDDSYDRVPAGRASAYRLRTSAPVGVAGKG
ncbi:MAG TPA: protein-glutamate O-methyltransferase CheR [Pilimelia sp.]|nr:protein-glutamate O-methyltransferase CheR [Pilimelia sp.]